MDSLVQSVDSQVVLFVAAIVVAVLLLQLLFRVLSVGFGTILAIVVIVFVMQYLFGISPNQLWFELSHLPQDVVRMVKGFG